MSTVIRVEKTNNYVVMSNTHLRETELSLKAKGLLSMMLSLPPNWDYSIGGLVAICKESQTAIRSTLKELEQFKYLKRNRMKDEKGLFIYEYVIYEHPYDENLHADKQHTDFQYIDSGHAENVRQLNKEKLNKDKSNKDKQNKEDKKKGSTESYNSILNESINDNDLKELYIEFIKLRQMHKKPLTNRALKMLITRVERLSNMDIAIQKKMLENAIMNGWTNVYIPDQKREDEQTLKSLKNFYGA